MSLGRGKRMHADCSPWKEEDEEIEEECVEVLRHIILSEHLEHIKRQADQSGLDRWFSYWVLPGELKESETD